ncbi:beta-lactamase domain-containing protein 2-like [Glandiceps talaboti]
MFFYIIPIGIIVVTTIVIVVARCGFKKRRLVRVEGYAEPGFKQVLRVFRKHHEQGLEAGSAFSVYYKGKKVVDLWGGYANVEAGDPWQQDTMSTFFSATKGVVALCIAVAVDRGYIDYDQKVADLWPEFGQNGKKDITVRQILNHEAGIPMTSQPLDLDVIKDNTKVGKIVASSVPLWKPGETHGYHSLNFGFVLSQIVQRVDPSHRTVGVFFREEIAKPFGIDFFIGLPKEDCCRVANIISPSPLYDMVKMLCISRYRKFALAMFNKNSLTSKVFRCNRNITSFQKMATDEFRSSEIPSVNGIGTARGLARLYAIMANGGEFEGKKLLKKETLQKIIAGRTKTRFDAIMLMDTQWCLGLHPHYNTVSKLKLDNVFGHNGFGGQGGFFDPVNNLSFAYVTTKLSPYAVGDDPRYSSLVDATYNSIHI